MVFKKKEAQEKILSDEVLLSKVDESIKKYEDITDEKLLDYVKEYEGKAKAKSNISQLYPYWVYLFRNDKKVKDFGVRVIPFGKVDLLIRIENVNGVNRVVFKELFPSPKFDTETIANNRNQIKQELNKLMQIEKTIEKELFNNKKEKKSYNYSLKDVRKAILEKSIQLDAIKYGRSFKYDFDLRNDKIPCFLYDVENTGFRILKKVQERKLFTEGSEIKRLDNIQQQKEIDEVLPKNNSRDWLKLMTYFAVLLFLGLNIWGAFQFMAYNEERAFNNANEKLDQMYITIGEGLNKITLQISNSTDDQQLINTIRQTNQDLIQEIQNLKTIEKKTVG